MHEGFRSPRGLVTRVRLTTSLFAGLVLEARETLLATGAFQSVEIDVSHHPATPGKVKVLTKVVER